MFYKGVSQAVCPGQTFDLCGGFMNKLIRLGQQCCTLVWLGHISDLPLWQYLDVSKLCQLLSRLWWAELIKNNIANGKHICNKLYCFINQ